MSFTERANPLTLVANVDLSAEGSRYKFIKIVNASGEGRAAIAGLGEDAAGTLYEGEVAGRPCTVMAGESIKCILNATLAAGAKVQSDANGLAIAVTGGGFVLGTLREGGVAGDIVNMLWSRLGTA